MSNIEAALAAHRSRAAAAKASGDFYTEVCETMSAHAAQMVIEMGNFMVGGLASPDVNDRIADVMEGVAQGVSRILTSAILSGSNAEREAATRLCATMGEAVSKMTSEHLTLFFKGSGNMAIDVRGKDGEHIPFDFRDHIKPGDAS